MADAALPAGVTTGRRSFAGILGWSCLAGLALAGVVWPEPMYDSVKLVRGFLRMLQGVDLSAVHPSQRDYFGLLQHLIVAPLAALRVSEPWIHVALTAANAAALSLFVVGWMRGLGRPFSSRHAAAVVLLLAGPLVIYSRLTFQEGLLAGLLGLWALTDREAHPWRWRWLVLLISVSKETAPACLLFVHFLHRVAETGEGRWRRPRLRRADLEALGLSLAGLGMSLAFNLWRFGTPHNLFYQMPELRVDSPRVWLEFAAAAWISPNGGLLLHWPFLLPLVAALTLSAGPGRARSGFWPSYFLGYTAFFAGTLALWHSPFGWVAWGDRLIVPWLVPLAVELTRRAPPDLFARAPWRIAALGALGLGLVHWLVYVKYPVAYACLARSHPGMRELDFWRDRAAYFECTRGMLWPPVEFLQPVGEVLRLPHASLVLLAVLGFGLHAVRRGSRWKPGEEPGSRSEAAPGR